MHYSALKELPDYNTSFIQNIWDQKSDFTLGDFESSDLFVACLPVFFLLFFFLFSDVTMKAVSFVLLK